MLTVISFIVVMGIIVFVHELGHLLAAKRNKIVVEEFGFGYPPRLIKLFERNGTIYSINLIPFGGFCRMKGEDDPSDPGNFASASRWARASTLLAGPFMNFALAVILFGALILARGVADTGRPGAVIQAIAPGSPAESGGLQLGDRIIAVDGQAVKDVIDMQKLTGSRLGKPTVYTLKRTNPSTQDELNVDLTLTPRTNPPAGQGALGISIGQAVRRAAIWEAAWGGVLEVANVIYQTFAIPANLIREGKPLSGAGFMGPVGIAVTTGGVVREAQANRSPEILIWYLALLSSALGLTNLLPLPALDGGRLLFIIVETIRRKRIEPTREGLVHLIGFGLLLLLVGLLTIKEVSALINGQPLVPGI